MKYSKLFNLSGKVALLVGGTGGLGKDMALGLAEFGTDIVLASRKPEKAQAIAEEIEQVGKKCWLYKVDVVNEEQVKKMVEDIIEKWGHIDIVINAAGSQIWQKAEEYTTENWDFVVDLNLKGTFLVCREVGKYMIKQGGGKIINISSVKSMLGMPDNYVAYCASKGGVNMYTKCLGVEWAKHNIQVNAIAPTFIETELTRDFLADEEKLKVRLQRIPMGRLGQPEDLVGAVLYFASPASNFITGQVIFADGGLTCLDG